MIGSSYNRTWICCGSYALLNALETDELSLIDVENSTGASFGLVCLGQEWKYNRLLTPYQDFNAGFDSAASFWGIHCRRKDVENGQQALNILTNQCWTRLLIGPVSMSHLTYLPCSYQYRFVDHYIAVNKKGGKLFLTDSEGVFEMPIDPEQLASYLYARDIPEANGLITLRILERNPSQAPLQDRLRFTLIRAAKLMNGAMHIRQGPMAFLRCCHIITRDPPSLWHGPLYYDLNYLIQRKCMHLELLRQLKSFVSPEQLSQIQLLLSQQIQYAGELCCHISANVKPCIAEYMKRLADNEYNITILMERMKSNGWNS